MGGGLGASGAWAPDFPHDFSRPLEVCCVNLGHPGSDSAGARLGRLQTHSKEAGTLIDFEEIHP